MLPLAAVLAASFAYLLLLFAVAWWADARARAGRSVIGNAWVYTLSIGVYCTAWTYFGSVGRAATSGLWFLPIYLGPTLAMLLAWTLLRKIVRIARTHRITSIADFVASRYGQSRAIAALVTLIALVGILPYIALQLKAIAGGLALLTGTHGEAGAPWWRDSTFAIALVLAGFTVAFGTRQLDAAERHEGMVAAIALESVVKLAAFLAVGVFVCWGLFDGPGDVFARAAAAPELAPLLGLAGSAGGDSRFAGGQWFALTLLAMLSLLFLPRQFQVMVVENVDERHLKRATWAFPLYLLLINLFVLPIALGGLLHFGAGADAETFVLSLPLSTGHTALALLAFVGGLSAATGMVIVESIAVATMVSNDWVVPLLLRTRAARDLSRSVLAVRRGVIVALLLLGYLYFRVAGEAYALVSIGLISFAAVAQFAPALIGGLYWKGGTRAGALVGLAAGFALWLWTLLLPSIAKSGWLPIAFVNDGPWGLALLRPEQLFGLAGLDSLTHALLWSLLANTGLYLAVSLARAPSAREAAQALRFVDVFGQGARAAPLRWRAQAGARLAELRALAARFLGADAAVRLFADYAQRSGAASVERIAVDAPLVRHLQTQLAGAIGSASAQAVVATVVEEEPIERADLLRLLDEASQVRALNRQLESLDKLKDDFMSSVTHELRTPLTSIRAFAELMRDDPGLDAAQRQRFIGLIVDEAERLSRLVNQVLDMAKIESGQGDWRSDEIDLRELVAHALQTTSQVFRERGATVTVEQPEAVPLLRADRDRLLQVLLNLLSNAAKFVPEGQGRITVALRCDQRAATIEVRDNGPGVPREQQQTIFEKFRQGGSATNRPQGTGLGLPISRKIVEHFGGRLWLASEPGQGATFGFELPWQREQDEQETKT